MKRTFVIAVLLIAAIGTVAAAGEDQAGNYWANWRGPEVNGYAPHGDPPTEWGEKKNIRWKVELPGPGHATPVVWGDRIYVLSAVSAENSKSSSGARPSTAPAVFAGMQQGPPPGGRGGMPPRESQTQVHRFVVSAFDRNTGGTIWETVVREEVPHERGHLTASQASASPVTDGRHVWAFFGSRGLYCLDKDGKVKWSHDLGRMRTRNEFGEGSSPALHGDTIVIQWDHEGDSFIVAFDKLTGEQRWKVSRDEPTSWTTPVVVEDGDRTLVIAAGTNYVRAYDLATGEEVWKCGGLGLNVVPTPIVDSGLIFVMSGYRDPAGLAIRYPGAVGDITDSAVAWRIDRGMSYVPSALLHDGKLYFLERFKAMLACYDLKTGKVVYEQQRLGNLGNIYASPVGAGNRVYVLDRDGNAFVFRAGKKFKGLAQNKLDDAFDASPVIVGNEMYLRGHEYLYAVAEVNSPDRSP